MVRSVFKFSYSSAEKTENALNNLLISNGYKQYMESDGIIWKKGSAFLTGERCIKIEWGNTEITISAWVSDGIFEMQLSGFSASFAKGQVLKVIEQIKLAVI